MLGDYISFLEFNYFRFNLIEKHICLRLFYNYYNVKLKTNKLQNYYKIVKKPMCLRGVEEKLNSDQYKTGSECIQDILLIFSNCYMFNNVSLFLSFLKKFNNHIL